MKHIHFRLAAAPVVLLALATASSLHAGPGVDFWMRKHVFEPQAKAAAAQSSPSALAGDGKKIEVTRIEHSYHGVPHQVTVQVPASAAPASAVAATEKPSSPSNPMTHAHTQ